MQLTELNARFPPGLGLGGLLSAGERSLSSWGIIKYLSLPVIASWFILRPLGKNYNWFNGTGILKLELLSLDTDLTESTDFFCMITDKFLLVRVICV